MRPFDDGWQHLTNEERLQQWYSLNKNAIVGPKSLIRTMMHNFCISCDAPTIDDFVNFCGDVRHFEARDQETLKQGFFAVYNTSPALLELKSYRLVRTDLN
ncbi:MAG: hypothetical protein AABY13_05665 [Nanoarchaeota archaeon]